MLNTIKELCAINAVSGKENPVREYIISKISPETETQIDALGNLIVYKKGRERAKNKVMLAAHMDEVGIIVTSITPEGFIKFQTVGGIDPKVLLGKSIIFENGLNGVCGLKPVHLIDNADRKKMPEIKDMYIDIGAADKSDAEKHLSAGDTGTFNSRFFEFGDNKIKSKALDDRAGCAVLLDMLNSELEYDTIFAFTSREEVGAVGAGTAAFSVKPDYAIVIETTTAADIIDVEDEKRVCVLADGAAVSFMDRATVYDPLLYKTALEVAAREGIKAQPKTAVAGGNDAGTIHKSAAGVKTITINIPCRYIHSPACVADKRDIESVRRLAEALAKEFCNA